MNKNPQEFRQDGPTDLLDQIISQELEKMNAPAQTLTAGVAYAGETQPAPKQENSEEAASPAKKKNRRSSVYLYLLILFGAAFLMLLLAYFAQQRGNETASGLQEELLDKIRDLEEKNSALNEELDLWKGNSWQWQARYEEESREAAGLQNQFNEAMKALYAWSATWTLDQYYRAGDYEGCAAVFLMQAHGQSTYSTDSANARYREIHRAVIDAGILDADYDRHPEDYSELLKAYLLQQYPVTEKP